MSDPTSTPPAAPAATSGLTVNDAVNLVEQLGGIAATINPLWGGAVAAITGIAQVIEQLVPEIKNLHDTQLSIAQQAQTQADSALLRARVGAPPAAVN